MEKDRTKLILATVVWVLSFVLYLSTIAPTVSFWDCGEFIACAYTMGVPHPPGSPLFILIGRLFSLLPTGADPAFRMNVMSPVSSAFANMLVFLIIVKLVKIWRNGLETPTDKLIAYAGAFIGAMAFAGTDSHWFNSVESEVYAMSTFATALVVWLILLWAERADKPGDERYLLLIAYVIGLAIGVHLLNLLTLPVIALIIYFRKFKFEWSTFFATVAITGVAFLVIYIGIIKGVVKIGSVTYLGGNIGFYLLALLVIAIFIATWWAVKSHHQIVSLALMSVILILIGYSSYTLIYIRANQDPTINENDPATPNRLVAYLEREQYGSHSITNRSAVFQESKRNPGAHIADRVNSTGAFVWEYQIKYMYIRYFNWQFIGRSGHRTDIGQFFALPFLLGLLGMLYHFQRDGKRAFAILALFVMTGLAVIIYLNQPDPQPRERDYSYVGSFMAFSMWIGIGASGIIELITDKLKGSTQKVVAWISIIVLVLIAPAQMIAKNYREHNRSGNYVAWDYSYNILQTCEPNAIIFTNGDNDTFPLWYLQEVEHIRTDVKIVNLSLLNTHWYIKQLRDYKPKILPASFTDKEIDQITPRAFQKQKIRIPAPKTEKNEKGYIEFTMSPTYAGQGIRVQDLMILRILADNFGKRPVYFAITVAQENKINLDDFLRMDGLALKVMPYKLGRDNINPEVLKTNLYDKYQYRNLGNPKVFFNDNIQNLLQNYRSVFLQLALYYYFQDQKQDMVKVLDKMNEYIPEKTIPITNREVFLQIGQLYAQAGRTDQLRERVMQLMKNPNMRLNRKIQVASLLWSQLKDYATADSVFSLLYESNPDNGQVVGNLIQIYQSQKRWQQAVDVLQRWLDSHPGDKDAQQLLDQYQQKMNAPDSSIDTSGS